MKFVDEVRIFALSGKGGDGAIAFLREKFRPRGGPDGGDGGKGGDVVFVADPNINTLLDLRYSPRHIAEDGQNGGKGSDTLVGFGSGTNILDAGTADGSHDSLYGGWGTNYYSLGDAIGNMNLDVYHSNPNSAPAPPKL